MFFNGSLVMEGDRIVVVDDSNTVDAYDSSGAEVIDTGGKVVMSGLVNLHYCTALGEEWSDHLPLWEILA